MNVKRFVAPDMRRALRLVREELGDDALIVSNKSTADGIEILASLDNGSVVAAAESRSAVTNSGSSKSDSAASHLTNDQLNKSLIYSEKSHRPIEIDPKSTATTSTYSRANPSPAKRKYSESGSDYRNRYLRGNKEIARLTVELDEAKKELAEGKHELITDAESIDSKKNPVKYHVESEEGVHSADNYRVKDIQTDDIQSDDIQSDDIQVDNRNIKLGNRFSVTEENFQSPSSPLQNTQNGAMELELKQLRDLLTLQMGEAMWGNMSYKSPVHAQVLKRLSALGLTNKLCKKILALVGDEENVETAWRRALVEITKQIPTTRQAIVDEGGVVALVGPSGVGKTTTIAKIAASYVLEYGAEDLALVTTDTYRIGAHEQLKTLGRILNVSVHIVSDDKSLSDILQHLGHKHLVLVDTAGLTRGHAGRQEQIDILKTCEARIRHYVVLATTHQLQVQRAAVDDLEALSLCGCILTKLDETGSLGESISVLLEKKLPVVHLTDGQKIPDDIHMATGPKIVSSAVSMMDEQGVDEMTMSALVGSLGLEQIKKEQVEQPLNMAFAHNG